MIIQEKDFKIIFNDDHYVLYLLKSKKELKENNEDNFRVGGYFIQLKYAIKGAYKFRKSKNYPGKENPEEILKYFEEYLSIEKSLYKLSRSLYTPIINLKEKILNYEKS